MGSLNPVTFSRFFHLPRGQADDHDPLPVGAEEILPVSTVKAVSGLAAGLARRGVLADDAQMPQHRRGHVLERQVHGLPRAMAQPVAFGSQQAETTMPPAIASQAGRAWATGSDEPSGPVAMGKPTAGFTV